MSEQRWQDWGRHEFTYGITGHKGDWKAGKLHKEAMRFEQRPAAFVVPKYNGKMKAIALLDINTDQINIQAVKMAEDGSGVIVRLQELYGEIASNIVLSSIKSIQGAEKMDGAERPLNSKIPVVKGKLSLNFTPFEIKTLLLKIAAETPNPVLTKAVDLKYDTDIFSYNESTEDGYLEDGLGVTLPRSEGYRGSFDGKGGTYPAEMIGDKIQLGNIEFAIGPRTLKTYNAVQCIGQTIDLPRGTRVLHLLAASDVDQEVVFKAGTKALTLTIGGWAGFLGSWDNREFKGEVAELSYSLRNPLKTIQPAFYRNHRVAWSATHHHIPTGDKMYGYSYLFAYRLDIPEGVTTITLPNSRFVRIAAMSVGDEGQATPLQSPFEDLYRDEEFKNKFYHFKY